MPDVIEVKGIINDLKSKIGRKGNRFCEFNVRMPTDAATVEQLIKLQGPP